MLNKEKISPYELGVTVLVEEADALRRNAAMLDKDNFNRAVEIIGSCKGKVVVSGLGKSGHVAAKIASTMASTGTPAFFLHSSEGQHGDFGMLGKDDCLLAIANSGETFETVRIARFAKYQGLAVVGITGRGESSLARIADSVLVFQIGREADPLNLAPTASTTVCLGIGDALAVAVMQKRGFTREHFALFHPEGNLGRALQLVDELMHFRKDLPVVYIDSDFNTILEAVTKPNFGIVAVVKEEDGTVIGAITDGDLRRALLKYGAEALKMPAKELMNTAPKTIIKGSKVEQATFFMQDRSITSLFVVDDGKKYIGLVRLHDLLSLKRR